MELYQELYENRLFEMPHVFYGDKGFDLEYENINDPEKLLLFLEDILSGKVYKDKHGEVIQLNNRNERIKFLNSLKDNDVFNNIVNHKFSDNEKKLLKMLLNSYM